MEKCWLIDAMARQFQKRSTVFHRLKALVTGATSGLGRATTFQLARDGADVTVHGRDATRGAHVVEEIQLLAADGRRVRIRHTPRSPVKIAPSCNEDAPPMP
jgi:NAD(P)-dependent dehydrogenase (short-subunit alcohol dehydrogenase family)